MHCRQLTHSFSLLHSLSHTHPPFFPSSDSMDILKAVLSVCALALSFAQQRPTPLVCEDVTNWRKLLGTGWESALSDIACACRVVENRENVTYADLCVGGAHLGVALARLLCPADLIDPLEMERAEETVVSLLVGGVKKCFVMSAGVVCVFGLCLQVYRCQAMIDSFNHHCSYSHGAGGLVATSEQPYCLAWLAARDHWHSQQQHTLGSGHSRLHSQKVMLQEMYMCDFCSKH